ncbi:hypothetical protein AB0I28_07410 [Phytomonospora sp. NPDC050363]|uniref:hypothetical protein n=1 Tax=Phytomonospora sp. NPDC050363 TaxID=3155642 RepID=UPI0033D4E9E8
MSDTAERVPMGVVSCPSGVLVVTDMGYLESWSGEGQPGGFDTDDEQLREVVASARDFRLVGSDASAAAESLGLSGATHVYDLPAQGVERLEERFAEEGWSVELVPEAARVAHRERVRRVTVAGGGVFQVNGVPSVAIPVPAGRDCAVVGKVGGDGFPRCVEVRLGDGEPATECQVGGVGVDWARLILADADALGDWVHEESLDGLADAAFWGADAAEAAEHFGAPLLPEGVHGWADLPVAEAAERVLQVRRWKAEGGKGLVADFRPHSHHFHMMARLREGDGVFGHGGLQVGRARTLAFTTGGDGHFPVVLSAAADGSPVRLRIGLGED